MKNLKGTFRISAKYFFYAGTFNAPKNGPLKDNKGENLCFQTRADALKYIENMFAVERASNGSYYPKGRYDLSHGEYSQPEFKIIKNK